MAAAELPSITLCDGQRPIVIDLLEIAAYLKLNRTRPASIRKDMHTGRVFYFQLLATACAAASRPAGQGRMA